MSCLVVFCSPMFSFFFFKQKTAYEMRISDWSSDGCSSDLRDRLYRAGDMAGRERTGKEMAGMAKSLERDPQVELVLRNRTRELGLEIGMGRGRGMNSGDLGRELARDLGIGMGRGMS